KRASRASNEIAKATRHRLPEEARQRVHWGATGRRKRRVRTRTPELECVFSSRDRRPRKRDPTRAATRRRTKYHARSHPPTERQAAIGPIPARSMRAAESAEQLPSQQS